jgi:hypothetical protein
VAILVAADCNVREVSEWAGHNSVAFTLSRYGGLFEDGSEAAVDRLDTLLGGGSKDSDNVLQLDTRKTEVSPERVPEPILTRQGRTDIKPASASGATHFVTQKWCSTSERAAPAVSVLTAGPCRARRARGSCGPQSHIMDLSTSNSAPGEDGSKPCSISQRAATRLRHDHHARITSRSTSVP